MIKIEHLTKIYKNKIVLNNFTGNFYEGDFCALVGSNGAGKSTFLKILSHLELQNEGLCQLEGKLSTDDSHELKEKVAFISEDIQFFFPGTLEVFLNHFKTFYPEWDDDFLQYLFTHHFIDKKANFNECSRGQKMQLVLAASLARKPKYIFIDEVTAVMDVFVRKVVIDYLNDYVKKNKAIIILATNIITEVDFLANKMLMFHEGNVAAFDEISNLKNNFVKLRKLENEDHDLFCQKQCVLIARNSDKSLTYMMKLEDYQKEEYNNVMKDKREIKLSDIFSYLSSTLRRA